MHSFPWQNMTFTKILLEIVLIKKEKLYLEIITNVVSKTEWTNWNVKNMIRMHMKINTVQAGNKTIFMEN